MNKTLLKNKNNPIRYFFLVILSFSFLSACSLFDDDDDDIFEIVPTATVQVIHASPDAPAVNVFAGGNSLLEGFDYGNASGQVEVPAGALNVDVQALLVDGSTPSVIGPVDLELAEDTDNLVIAINTVDMIEPFIISREDLEIAADKTRVRIAHLAPQAPQVDIYVTAPGTDVSTTDPLASASFKEETGEIEVDAGDYQIQITPAGSDTVVFDSGTVSLPGGADLAILAIENTLTGSSPVQLLVAGETDSFYIRDVATPAELRVIHASPDAPNVDIVVNDGFTSPLIVDLPFADFAGFVEVAADTYNVKVVPNGATTPVVINADLALEATENYSVFAVDVLANIEPLVLTRDRRRISTEAKVDIIHASPAAGNVDIYVTAPRTDINTVDPNFSDIPFKASTDFVSLPEGNYEVSVTATGTKTIAIGPAAINLSAGGIYTAAAIDEVRTTTDPDGLPPGLILLDDFLD